MTSPKPEDLLAPPPELESKESKQFGVIGVAPVSGNEQVRYADTTSNIALK